MAELQAGKKSVNELLGNEGVEFYVPPYQRPYAWTKDECETLWEDISGFTVPDNDPTNFDRGDEYFLGPIVTFKEEGSNRLEIIDGQQRLTTLMLLLRVLYSRLELQKDEESVELYNQIGHTIWRVGEFGKPLVGEPKFDSEVASDEDLDELVEILKNGDVTPEMTSRYAGNFRLFQELVDEYIAAYPTYFKYVVNRLLRNVILLPIESKDRESALRIFSTLNNRGLPLSDADIFKAAMYQHYRDLGKEDEFNLRWQDLDEKLSGPLLMEDSPMTELFRLYMGYLRGMEYTGQKNRTAVREFFTRDKNRILKEEGTLSDLEDLADFWNRYDAQEGFSEEVQKDFLILKYAPNKLWQDAVSTYYLVNRGDNARLNQDEFHGYLQRLIAFLYGGVVAGMSRNWETREVDREAGYLAGRLGNAPSPLLNRFKEGQIQDSLSGLRPGKRINKGILAWWMMSQDGQPVMPLSTEFDVEHIYARQRFKNRPGEIDEEQLECLGNKSLLEKRINIRASDYGFDDKRAIYRGERGNRSGTEVMELLSIANGGDGFSATHIDERDRRIKEGFVEFLKDNGVLEEER